MKILVDTSAIVEIDRQKETTVDLFKKLTESDTQLLISTITVSEILTGSYLRTDFKAAVITSKEILSQFLWLPMDGQIAEKTAQLLAYLLTQKKSIEYQDTVIAATFLISGSDYLLTLNKKEFLVFPQLKEKVFSPEELSEKIKNSST